jgi:transcriptional regulator of acetoin/glycerol metabolism
MEPVQERTVRPVGATRGTAVDVSLMCRPTATGERAVRHPQLRKDLYYRVQAGVLPAWIESGESLSEPENGDRVATFAVGP